MPSRTVEYLGGPLDGERETIALFKSPDGPSWALPGKLTVPVQDRPDWQHVYRLGPSNTRYLYAGYEPVSAASF